MTMVLNDQSTVLNFLKTRKSASAKTLSEPGPNDVQVDEILQIAMRVPDHGKLAPWRYVVFEGEARAQVGQKFSARWAELNPTHGAEILAFQSQLFLRAPLIIVVVSSAAAHVKIPIWEQQMSAAASCFACVLASQALGFDAQWQSDWVAFDVGAKAAMGVASHENIAGIIYIGTTTVPLEDRPRPDPSQHITKWHL